MCSMFKVPRQRSLGTKVCLKPGTVLHACDPSIGRWHLEDEEVKNRVSYLVSLRPSWDSRLCPKTPSHIRLSPHVFKDMCLSLLGRIRSPENDPAVAPSLLLMSPVDVCPPALQPSSCDLFLMQVSLPLPSELDRK